MSAPQASKQASASILRLPCSKTMPKTRPTLSTRTNDHLRITAPTTIFNKSPARCISKPNNPSSTILLRIPTPTRTPPTRTFSTASTLKASSSASLHTTEPTPLPIDEYHKLSDAYIDTLVAKLEELQEEREDIDVEYSVSPSPLHPFIITTAS